MSNKNNIVIPREGRAAHPAWVWLGARRGPSRGTCGSLASLRCQKQPQILRLRARPTRKTSGPESLCGRSAQDDILKFMNNPAEGPHYPFKDAGL